MKYPKLVLVTIMVMLLPLAVEGADEDATVQAANSSDGPGVLGTSVDGPGIKGMSDNDIGVYGETGGTTVYDYGVYGVATGIAYAVHGYQSTTPNGLGVYGRHAGGGSGVSGYNEGDGNGVWGFSANYNGVGGGTNRVDNDYGLFSNDNLYSLNIHTSGAVMQVVLNGDETFLERGDVVEIAGIDRAPYVGNSPVIKVRKSDTATSTGVIGVVVSTFSDAWLQPNADPTGATGTPGEIELSRPGPIAPNEYLLVAVQGPALVKTNIAGGVIQPGDLLSTASEHGCAVKAPRVSIAGAETAMPGTVLGKALESSDDKDGLIYVYVSLQ